MSSSGLVGQLVPAPAIVVEADPHDVAQDPGGLLPEETLSIARAGAKRRREFVAGRVLARGGMRRLGLEPEAIPMGPDRAPRWPDGVVGSITHTDRWCAVALGRADEILAIGIDVEVETPLAAELWPLVCTPDELARLRSLPPADGGSLAKLLFSAKETAYKSQYPLTKQFLDFAAMVVEVDVGAGRWHATFVSGQRPAGCPWASLEGRWARLDGLIATAAMVPR